MRPLGRTIGRRVGVPPRARARFPAIFFENFSRSPVDTPKPLCAVSDARVVVAGRLDDWNLDEFLPAPTTITTRRHRLSSGMTSACLSV